MEKNFDDRPMDFDTIGTLESISDDATHVQQDNGSGLDLVIGEDSFSGPPLELTTLKLYMPLTADYYERNEYGDLDYNPTYMDSRDLTEYEDQIISALEKERMPEESEHGLMHWYDKDDAVKQKVRSVVFTAEIREKKLWGVAECRVAGTLEPNELNTLKEYITGQASDGWGEGFEQHEIETADGELYVHLWDSGDWSIETEQERFALKLAEGLPDVCFSISKSTGELICVKKGESGYYHSNYNTPDKEYNMELANELNERLGVTPKQRRAMENGSMFGWTVPAADPAHYDAEGIPIRPGERKAPARSLEYQYEQAKFIGQSYRPGMKIVLDEKMEDPYCEMPAGLTGIVDSVDDLGQIHCHWENGSSLALIPGVDHFHKDMTQESAIESSEEQESDLEL